jgi:ATP-binding cassette subfamily B protein
MWCWVADFNNNYMNFTKAVLGWLGLSLEHLISRIAKISKITTNIIIQRTEAHAEGIQKHITCLSKILKIKSWETLVNYKSKIDCEKYITLAISMVFQTLMESYLWWFTQSIFTGFGPIFLATVPVIAISSLLGKKIKKVSVEILRETTALAGATTESLRNIELVKV